MTILTILLKNLHIDKIFMIETRDVYKKDLNLPRCSSDLSPTEVLRVGAVSPRA